MKEIRYVLMDPSGNRTILVQTLVPVSAQPAVAARLMQAEPTAEQVGFLTSCEKDAVTIRMAGGEFCANAAMSAGVYCGMQNGSYAQHITVDISGAPKPLAVCVEPQPDGVWRGTVEMDLPRRVQTVCLADGQDRPVVCFPGISHVIFDGENPDDTAEQTAKYLCEVLNADALGLMFLDREAGCLTPLVYVPAAETIFWENSCGSGTAAVGAYLAAQTEAPVSLSLRQPGGVLEVSAAPDGTLLLKGRVRCLYEKAVSLSDT